MVPDRHIAGVSVPCIGGDQIECHVVSLGGRRNFETHLARGDERRYWHLPRLRPVTFADVSDRGETPERLLPCADCRGDGGRFVRRRAPPLRADLIEQERWFRRLLPQHVPQRPQIFRMKTPLACNRIRRLDPTGEARAL